MNNEQIYNPVMGINRMIEDIQSFVNPMIFSLQPLLRVISIANIYIVAAVLIGLLAYMIFVRKHAIVNKLTNPSNYFAAGALLLVYAVLTETPLKLGSEMSLNLGLVVMPMAAKLFGPILAGAFGILQYATSFVMHAGETFDLSAMLVAAISGIIYGWFIYMRRTSYLGCLWAKLTVNIICNVLLVPFITGDVMSEALADSITQNIVNNIVLAPVQALAIFVALIILRKIREYIAKVPWGLGK